jgi:hypothetical protein
MLEKIKVGAFDSTADDFASGGCGGGACPPGWWLIKKSSDKFLRDL